MEELHSPWWGQLGCCDVIVQLLPCPVEVLPSNLRLRQSVSQGIQVKTNENFLISMQLMQELKGVETQTQGQLMGPRGDVAKTGSQSSLVPHDAWLRVKVMSLNQRGFFFTGHPGFGRRRKHLAGFCLLTVAGTWLTHVREMASRL